MAPFTFLHSADLHLGKRFGFLPDEARPGPVQARTEILPTLARTARAAGAAHILLAGDTFDTETPAPSTLRQALTAMGGAPDLTWWILPGNHDSLAAEALWDQARTHAAANTHIIAEARPIEIAPGVTLLPAPPPHRFSGHDLTVWMDNATTPDGHLRLGLAHGSTVDFGTVDFGTVDFGTVDFGTGGSSTGASGAGGSGTGSSSTGSSSTGGSAETIAADRATTARLDYLALGDWHGTRAIGPRTWYAGTPEPDRFKHEGPGRCLIVTLLGPGALPQVREAITGRYLWTAPVLDLTPEADIDAALPDAVPSDRAEWRTTLVRLTLRGRLTLDRRASLFASARAAAPEFCHFEIDDTALAAEIAPETLDEIATDGALRQAADLLNAEARDSGRAAEDRRIAEAALARLYGLVRGDSP